MRAVLVGSLSSPAASGAEYMYARQGASGWGARVADWLLGGCQRQAIGFPSERVWIWIGREMRPRTRSRCCGSRGGR